MQSNENNFYLRLKLCTKKVFKFVSQLNAVGTSFWPQVTVNEPWPQWLDQLSQMQIIDLNRVAAALHHCVPDQITWLQGWPTLLAAWLKIRPMNVESQLHASSILWKNIGNVIIAVRFVCFILNYFECHNRRCLLACCIIAWRSLIGIIANLFTYVP
jgi:hypothetical protein